MCVYVWGHICATVCALAFGSPVLMSGIFFDHPSTLYFESGSPASPELAGATSLDRKLAHLGGPPFPSSEAGVIGGTVPM